MAYSSSYLVFLAFLLGGNVSAQENAETIDNIMHGIGIKFLISDDRKIPKDNRQEWESSLSKLVDFDSLNPAISRRVVQAYIDASDTEIDLKTRNQVAQKVALFLVPRQLSNYMVAYLRKSDEAGPPKPCLANQKPGEEDDYILCLHTVSDHELHVKFIGETEDELANLVFTKQDDWRLSDMQVPITDRTLTLIAMWK